MKSILYSAFHHPESDGFIGNQSIKIKCSLPKSSKIDNGLHCGPGLPQRIRDAVKVAVCAERPSIELTAARLGKDARIAVSQHNDRSLD